MNETEQTYTVPTYSWVCTAYVRTTLRRALELQPTENVWAGTDNINAAVAMVPNTYTTTRLPDETTWELTKIELLTIKRALEWRRGKRNAGTRDVGVDESLIFQWGVIEAEVTQVLRGIWHSEGKYWM